MDAKITQLWRNLIQSYGDLIGLAENLQTHFRRAQTNGRQYAEGPMRPTLAWIYRKSTVSAILIDQVSQ